MSGFLGLDFWQALVPALLHTLWVGAVSALGLAAILRWLPASRGCLRYVFSLVGMLVVVMGGLVAWGVENRSGGIEAERVVLQSKTVLPIQSSTPEPSQSESVESALSSSEVSAGSALNWQAWAAALWLVGLALMLVRFFLALGAGARLRRSMKAGNVAGSLQELCDRVCGQIGVRMKVALRVSEEVAMPAVIGVFRPVILWPSSWLTGLSQDQLVAVLSHELAHIRRHDYLINLLQMLIEAVLFFNPAVWWISRQIRLEREACCDAEAAEVTGAPVDVARMLSQIAASSVGAGQEGMPSAAVALGQSESGLLERVWRLLDPEYRPSMRLSWPALGAAVIMFAVVLGLGGGGAELAVAAVLDGEEHVAKVREIQDKAAPLYRKGSYPYDLRVTVTGTVQTFDGRPIPSEASVSIESTRLSYSAGYGAKLREDGSFVANGVQPGKIQVSVRAAGYAPAVSEAILPRPGESVEVPELVLGEGFAMTALLMDESGHPIGGATLALLLMVEGEWVDKREVVTDAQGMARGTCLTAGELRATVQVPGFQKLTQSFDSVEGGELSLVLRKSRPVLGRVVDAATGEPVPNAAIRLVKEPGWGGSDPRDESLRNADPFTQGNLEGVFAIDTLEERKSYTFWFEADGYRPQFVSGIKSGDGELLVAMEPEITISVILNGPLEALPKGKDGKPELRYRQNIEVDESYSIGSGGSAPVRSREGVATAVFDQLLLPGAITIEAPTGARHFSKAEDVGETIIDLSSKVEDKSDKHDEPKRRVIVKVTPPEGWPAPEGQLRVDYLPPGKQSFEMAELDLDEGQAEIDVPLGEDGAARFCYGPIDSPGFWIEEKSGIVIERGDEPEVLEVRAYPGGTVSGVVLDDDGDPISEAQIGMTVIRSPENMPRPDPNWWRGDARSDGAFVLSPVPLGGLYRPVATFNKGGRVSRVFGENLSIDAENPNPEVTLTIPAGKDIKVRVFDDEGAPLPNAELSWNYRAKQGGLRHSGMVADQHGEYVFRGVNFDLPVEYFVGVKPTDELMGLSRDVDADHDVLDLRLQRGIRLEGVLVDDLTGKPLVNRRIDANARAPEMNYGGHIWTKSDAEGRFVFGNLEPGQYRLSVDSTAPQGVVVERQTGGGHRFTYPTRKPGEPDPSVVSVPAEPDSGTFELRVVPF
ncbi:MAG: carboxypeptidase regulatory-like domain-containing protein [Verrucomicrobiales bacterium]|nr:carboxypeptidase regulatory-like domain-containing protein [Verrucomicrobiales bacterium]